MNVIAVSTASGSHGIARANLGGVSTWGSATDVGAASGPPSHRTYCGLSTLFVIVTTATVAKNSQPSVSTEMAGTRRARFHSTPSTISPATVATVLSVMTVCTPAPTISRVL